MNEKSMNKNKNFDQLEAFVKQLKYQWSVIGIAETWLKHTPSSLYHIEGFTFASNNRTEKRVGGVGMYIPEGLDYIIRDELTIISNTIETIFVELHFPHKKNIFLGEIYRPPNTNPKDFIETLQSLLSAPTLNNKTCIIMGDFNLDSQAAFVIYFDKSAKFDFSLSCVQRHHNEQLSTFNL